VKAVKGKQVFKQPIGVFIFDRPTAEAAVLYPLWLAKNAYPQLFKDVDMMEEVKRFYREIMDFPLSDEEARAVLEGAYSLKFGPAAGKR
jgi:iron complex transport system substrate-binding protein